MPKNKECLPVYPIWIAEVMLQQTQLKVVLPYWEKWMEAFPDLVDLSSALNQEVLLFWQGLGYYSRAHRLHKASKDLVQILWNKNCCDNDLWPMDIDTWMSLPGIGRTTAASILSSAFDIPEAILDGNVKRILSRLVGKQEPLSNNSKQLWELSIGLLDHNQPRNFNQALMDLGATICTKNSPKCDICPWKSFCLAYDQGNTGIIPLSKPSKVLKKLVIGLGIVFNDSGEVLIDQRLNNTSMAGMWEFPGGKKEEDEVIKNTISRELLEELGVEVKVGKKLIEFDHFYTHKKLHFVVHFCSIISGMPKALASIQIKWVKPDELINYPFPAANKRIIDALENYLLLSKDKLIL